MNLLLDAPLLQAAVEWFGTALFQQIAFPAPTRFQKIHTTGTKTPRIAAVLATLVRMDQRAP